MSVVGGRHGEALRLGRQAVAWVAIATSVVVAEGAGAEGINLSWDDCGVTGPRLKTFSCNTNAGEDVLVGSFRPPDGMTEFLGISVDLRITSETETIPDWWHHGTGLCRGTTGLATDLDFTGNFNCMDFYRGSAAGGFAYDVGFGAPNQARLRIQCAVPFENRGPISSANEYYAFMFRLQHNRSIGTGSCAGCAETVSIRLNEIQLFQPPEQNFDPTLTSPLNSTEVYWQNGPEPPPGVFTFAPPAGHEGTPVMLTGSNFTGASMVQFNYLPTSFTVNSDTEIETVVPFGARTGPIQVTTVDGPVVSAGTFVVAPQITGFEPAQAPIGYPVRVTGINFTATSAVRFNSATADFTILSDTELSAVVPASATDGPITVVNPGGSDVSDDVFRIGPVQVEGGAINFSWNDCVGPPSVIFGCNNNVGPPFTAVASFVPPTGIMEFLGLSAQIGVHAIGHPTIPDWWQHGIGLCRGTTGLNVGYDFTSGPFSCLDPYYGAAVGGFRYDVGFGGPNRARLLVQAAIPFENRLALDPGSEFYAFKVILSRDKTTGVGACSGCIASVHLTLDYVQLFQPPELGFDPMLYTTTNGNVVGWQEAGLPVLVSVVTAEATSDRVRLVWQTEDVEYATVHRREGEGAWRQVATLVPDGLRRVTYEDIDITPGATYDYRLGIQETTGEVYMGETSVTVPASSPAPLALARVAWDGSAGALVVSLSLPQAGSAAFELFDVNGRRVGEERLEGLEAGEHQLSLRPAQPLMPGVFFARVTQNGEAASRRFVVVQ